MTSLSDWSELRRGEVCGHQTMSAERASGKVGSRAAEAARAGVSHNKEALNQKAEILGAVTRPGGRQQEIPALKL